SANVCIVKCEGCQFGEESSKGVCASWIKKENVVGVLPRPYREGDKRKFPINVDMVSGARKKKRISSIGSKEQIL
ncbi:723_t:CDS:1, partial [Dentiscutata heterogama]